MLLQAPVPNHAITQIIEVIKKEEQTREQLYTIKEGDYLSKIATDHQTTISRLWAKNTELVDPDHIESGKVLKVPQVNETLPDRPFPVIVNVQPLALGMPLQVNTPHMKNVGLSSSGNTYSPGYCTYGVKQWRPEIPNNWGNADTWYANAAAQGWAVGYEPRGGAIAAAISYMHVALVLEVRGNRIKVREMNYGGLWVVSERLAPASEFRYIY